LVRYPFLSNFIPAYLTDLVMAQTSSYSRFFHDLRSRQGYPKRLELSWHYPHLWDDEYSATFKDFTHALKESQSLHKAHSFHRNGSHAHKGIKEKAIRGRKVPRIRMGNTSNGTSDDDQVMTAAILLDSKRLKVHLSILPDALSPSSRRLFFLRAPAYQVKAWRTLSVLHPN
jgi:hypothetical protein